MSDQQVEQRAREIYAERPVLTPFSLRPVSFDVATALGTRTASRAWRQAWIEEGR